MENHKVFDMPFSKVYGLLVAEAELKGRTKDEVCRLVSWLTDHRGFKVMTPNQDLIISTKLYADRTPIAFVRA